jgi:hypothetical protein
MKTLVLLSIALGSVAVACAPPTTINITPAGGTSTDPSGGEAGSDGSGGIGGSQTTEPVGGSGGDPVVQPETANSYYVSTVHPTLIQVCGGCHNPDGVVGAPAFLDYDAQLSYVVTKDY